MNAWTGGRPALTAALTTTLIALLFGAWATMAVAHTGHGSGDGRILGKPDVQRIGNAEVRFHSDTRSYTYRRNAQEPPFSFHTHPVAATGASYDLPTSEEPIVCTTTGHQIRVMYATTASPATPSAGTAATIRSIVRRMNWKLRSESIESSTDDVATARLLRMRVQCDGAGEIRIHELPVSNGDVSHIFGRADSVFGAPTGADSVKNLIFFDGRDPGGAAGYGGVYDDDRKSNSEGAVLGGTLIQGNENRYRTTSAVIYNPPALAPPGYWDTHVSLHELSHAMGAVQPTAPYATPGNHCIDGIDVMCYSDGAPGYTETRCPSNGYFNTAIGTPLDCFYDSYFDAVEESSEWLSTHWNTGGPENPFVETPMYSLRNSNTSGSADLAFPLTPQVGSDLPLAGDWNGDGVDTIGIYRPSNGSFYLRNSNSKGPADIVFSVSGNPTDRPVVGDWNGDGADTVGVFRPGSSTFYLRNMHASGRPQYQFVFGATDDLPVAGDWDNNGTDTIGLYRPSTGFFYLRNANSAGAADYAFAYGNSGTDDLPVAGDWDGNGAFSVGVYRRSLSQWFLDNDLPAANPISYTPLFGARGFSRPIAGDWDNSGTDTPGAVRTTDN